MLLTEQGDTSNGIDCPAQTAATTTPAIPATPLNTPARGSTPARDVSLHGLHAVGPQHGAVLVVDDLALNRIVLGHMVRKAGLEVVEAANGAECLEQLCNNPPGRFECILMDLQMPVMDGWQATQQVRLWEAGGGQISSGDSRLGTSAPSATQDLPLLHPLFPVHCTLDSSAQRHTGMATAQLRSHGLISHPLEDCSHDRLHAHSHPQSGSSEHFSSVTMQSRPSAPLDRSRTCSRPSSPPLPFPDFVPDRSPQRGSSPPLMRALSRNEFRPSSNFMLAHPRPHSSLFSDLPSTSQTSPVLPSTTQQHQQQWAWDGLSICSTDARALAGGGTMSAPVIRRIPIVACTAELLDSPPSFRGGDPADGTARSGLPPSEGATAASHALSCGVDECVKKPLSYPTLCGILERYIPHWVGPVSQLVPRSGQAAGSSTPAVVRIAPLSAVQPVPSPAAEDAAADRAAAAPVQLRPTGNSAPVLGTSAPNRLALLAARPSWPSRNAIATDSQGEPGSASVHRSGLPGWPASLVSSSDPILIPSQYVRSISGEPESTGPLSPLAGAGQASQNVFRNNQETSQASVTMESTPAAAEQPDRSSQESFCPPSFALFDPSTGQDEPCDEATYLGDLSNCNNDGMTSNGSGSAFHTSGGGMYGDGSMGSASFACHGGRSPCDTPTLDVQEPDIQEHLVELMPYMSSSSPLERVKDSNGGGSGSGHGSWCGPMYGIIQAGPSKPTVSFKPIHPQPHHAAPGAALQQRLLSLSRLASSNHARHTSSPPVETEASLSRRNSGDSVQSSQPENDPVVPAEAGSTGEDQHGDESISCAEKVGTPPWLDAVEEAEVRALCAWDPEHYTGLAGAEAALAEASIQRLSRGVSRDIQN